MFLIGGMFNSKNNALVEQDRSFHCAITKYHLCSYHSLDSDRMTFFETLITEMLLVLKRFPRKLVCWTSQKLRPQRGDWGLCFAPHNFSCLWPSIIYYLKLILEMFKCWYDNNHRSKFWNIFFSKQFENCPDSMTSLFKSFRCKMYWTPALIICATNVKQQFLSMSALIEICNVVYCAV